MTKLARFKKKRTDNLRARGSVSESDRVAARAIDPTDYLLSAGYQVKHDGRRHLSVRDGSDSEVYRMTERDGRWLWCDLCGNHGGDNIDLLREIEGAGYIEAVRLLAGAPIVRQHQTSAVSARRQPPRLPPQNPTARANGRDYLNGRGIRSSTPTAPSPCFH